MLVRTDLIPSMGFLRVVELLKEANKMSNYQQFSIFPNFYCFVYFLCYHFLPKQGKNIVNQI